MKARGHRRYGLSGKSYHLWPLAGVSVRTHARAPAHTHTHTHTDSHTHTHTHTHTPVYGCTLARTHTRLYQGRGPQVVRLWGRRTTCGPPPPTHIHTLDVTRLLVLTMKDISSTKCSIADDEGRESWGRVKSYHLV